MVEFALIITLLVLILAGATDLGRAAFQRITLFDAAEEGALYASVHPGATSGTCSSATSDGIIYRACTSSAILAGSPTTQVDSTLSGSACFGNTVTVSVSSAMDLIFPFAGIFTKSDGTPLSTITLNASATNTILSPSCSP